MDWLTSNFVSFLVGILSGLATWAITERHKIQRWVSARICYRSKGFQFFNHRAQVIDYLSQEFFANDIKDSDISIMSFYGGHPQLKLLEAIEHLLKNKNRIRLITSDTFLDDFWIEGVDVLSRIELRVSPETYSTKIVLNKDKGCGLVANCTRNAYEGFVTRDRDVSTMLEVLFNHYWERSKQGKRI